jgi:hypothetical protein
MIVNRHRSNNAVHITVRRGSSRGFGGDISYVWDEDADANRYNGWFSVSSDDYHLYLEDHDMMQGNREKLTERAAAERLWVRFTEQAGIEYGKD